MLLAFLPGFEQKQQISADNYRDGLESFLQKKHWLETQTAGSQALPAGPGREFLLRALVLCWGTSLWSLRERPETWGMRLRHPEVWPEGYSTLCISALQIICLISVKYLFYTFISIYRSIDRSIYRSIHLSIDPSIYWSIYLPIHLSIHPSIYLSPTINLSIYLSLYILYIICIYV